MTPLELEFFATGEEQHVFTRAHAPGDPWLYKIPAAFGRILPGNHALRSHLLKGRVGRALLRVPLIDRLDLAYTRFDKRRCHLRMVDQLTRLERLGISDVVLPFRILRDVEATLRLGDRSLRYQGHVVMQRRADRFWEKVADLASLDWTQIVSAQHRMWRHGVGLSNHRDVLGPRCWGAIDGRVALADTGTLTTSRAEARAALEPRTLARRIEKHVTKLGDREPVRAYFDFVVPRLSEQMFDELWRADLGPESPRRATAGGSRATV